MKSLWENQHSKLPELVDVYLSPLGRETRKAASYRLQRGMLSRVRLARHLAVRWCKCPWLRVIVITQVTAKESWWKKLEISHHQDAHHRWWRWIWVIGSGAM